MTNGRRIPDRAAIIEVSCDREYLYRRTHYRYERLAWDEIALPDPSRLAYELWDCALEVDWDGAERLVDGEWRTEQLSAEPPVQVPDCDDCADQGQP